jgi:RNA polymerase sigma-70 factor (ECF subfamily)
MWRAMSATAAASGGGRAEERELLRRLRAGDERAFDELVRAWHPLLVRLARRFVSSDAIAEEVAQEAWLGLLTGLERFEQRSSLRTWVVRIVVNRAISRGVREGRSVPESALEDRPVPAAEAFTAAGAWAAPPPAPPHDRAEQAEARAALLAALDGLPERQRAAVLLRDVAGLSGEEVAEALELSPGNVRVLLHRGRGHLRDALTEQWGRNT